MDIEARLKTVENEVREIREHVAKKDEVQWAIVPVEEAWGVWIRRGTVQVDCSNDGWIEASPVHFTLDCINNPRTKWRWRIPATEKKKRVVYEATKLEGSALRIHGYHDIVLGYLPWEFGTKLDVTITEAA